MGRSKEVGAAVKGLVLFSIGYYLFAHYSAYDKQFLLFRLRSGAVASVHRCWTDLNATSQTLHCNRRVQAHPGNDTPCTTLHQVELRPGSCKFCLGGRTPGINMAC